MCGSVQDSGFLQTTQRAIRKLLTGASVARAAGQGFAQVPNYNKECYEESLRPINLLIRPNPYSGFNGVSSDEQKHLVPHGIGFAPDSMAPGVVPFYTFMELMMSKIVSAVKAFVADENGVTAIEYGLIAALVGVAIVVTVKALGVQISDTFQTVVDNMKGTPATP